MALLEQFRRGLAFCLCGVFSAAAQTTPATTPQIEVNVNRVFLSVVVRDKQGMVVNDLKREDFQVFDNDQAQVVTAFTVQQHTALANHSSANPGITTPTPPGAAVPSPLLRFVVFLFDDRHLSFENLAAVKAAGVEALSSALGDADMAAVVATSGKINSGLTRDRNLLKSTILSLQPLDVYRSSRECPNISYYQADLIINKHDEPALMDATRQELNCNPSIKDPNLNPSTNEPNLAQRLADSAARQTLALADNDVMATYAALREYVRKMVNLPGQRMLILLSPGFLTIAPESLTQESRLIDLAAQSNITISALDARGLYTTELDASEHSPSMSGGSVQEQFDYRRTSMALAEGSMASLAAGTGGTFFHNRNDLGAGLIGLTAVPECVYLLEFAPSNAKPDGTYHHLKVKVDRDGLQIQARRGYFAPHK
jgi:VWFA-related protein